MLLKKMIAVLIAMAFTVGISSEIQASERKLHGLWKSVQEKGMKDNYTEKYYYFGKNGVFALPEQVVRTGISWKLSGKDALILVSSSFPADSPFEESFSIATLKRTKMILKDANGKQFHFKKIRNKIVRIDGKVMYRERMALPPTVKTRIELYADGKPFAINSLQTRGQVPIPFSIYFIARKKGAQITLDASLYHENDKLFGTINPVPVGMEYIKNKTKQKELSVLLYRSKPSNDVPSNDVPSSKVPNADFTNTYWRLTTLNGKEAERYEDQREAHFIIRDTKASGSDGCNNFFMPITYKGDKVTFKQGGSTMMFCPQGDAQAREFLQTLNAVDTWKINASVLELKEDNKVKLTFEAVYF